MTTRACKNTKDKRTEGEGKVDVLICDTEVGNLTFLDLVFLAFPFLITRGVLAVIG